MRSLVQFLVQYGGVGLFFVLEAVCLYLVVNYNQQQKEIWLNSSNIISGTILNFRSDISQYYNLSEFADSLAADNARLKARLNNAQFVQTILMDSSKNVEKQQQFTYISARIVNRTIHLHNNTFTIDRGRKHGIEPDMGVIDSNPGGGIVGIVTNVSDNYSVVMALLHQEIKVPAAIRRNQYHGFLSWQPSNPIKINLIDVPKHAEIRRRDTVETSTHSALFPAGIPVGVVDTFWQDPGSNFHTISAKLINDLGNVQYVYVVNNLMKGEIVKLEEEASGE